MVGFFKRYCDKIAEGVISKTSQKIAETVTVGIKPDAVKAAEITANGAQLAARITARATKIAATLQGLAALTVGGAAAYATYNYMYPIKDELAREKEKNRRNEDLIEDLDAVNDQNEKLVEKAKALLKDSQLKELEIYQESLEKDLVRKIKRK